MCRTGANSRTEPKELIESWSLKKWNKPFYAYIGKYFPGLFREFQKINFKLAINFLKNLLNSDGNDIIFFLLDGILYCSVSIFLLIPRQSSKARMSSLNNKSEWCYATASASIVWTRTPAPALALYWFDAHRIRGTVRTTFSVSFPSIISDQKLSFNNIITQIYKIH